MSLLSKSEILYLQGHKQVSKSYNYKLRSIIKKKVANLMDKEIPLLSSLFPDLDLTEFGKMSDEGREKDLTEISKVEHRKQLSTVLTKISKTRISLHEQRKPKECEAFESPKASPNTCIPIKTTKTIISIPKTKENQRRERDSNPRDLAVTSFM